MFSARLVARVVAAEGVPFLGPMNLPYLPGRIQFAEGLEGQWSECIETYAALEHAPPPGAATAHARKTLTAIRAGSTLVVPRDSVSNYLDSPRERFGPRRVLNLAADWRVARTPDAVSSPHSTYPDLLRPASRLARKARRRLLRDAFDREATSTLPGGRYAAYFIHSQPEVTVEGWAHEFQDQVATIRNIAAALPADLPLVVKEHRVQAGWRDPSFYKELHSVPGVLVLSDAVPSSDVIRGAEMVFTLTGTISIEAMCLGVPAVLFGSVYYEHFDGVERVMSWEHLREVVARRHTFQAGQRRELPTRPRCPLVGVPGRRLGVGRSLACRRRGDGADAHRRGRRDVDREASVIGNTYSAREAPSRLCGPFGAHISRGRSHAWS